jgi:polysaccharide biosynthesis protein PelE
MGTQYYVPPFSTVEKYFNTLDVHEKERVVGDEIIAIIISLLWTVLHGVNGYLLFWHNIPIIYSLLIHVALGLIAFLIAKILQQVGRDVRLLYVMAISSFGAGIFGAVGALLSGVLTIIYNHFAIPFSEWYKAIYPDFSVSSQQELYERITSGKDETSASYSVIAFSDIIYFGNEGQKRRAITRMTDQFHPLFAPAFKAALQDDSNTTRVQAASSIIKIENQFLQVLQQIEKMEQAKPNDVVLKLGLARYYDSFAFTGVLDENRELENRKLALQKYKQYLEMRPSDVEARIEAGRLLLRSGKADQAVEIFDDCIRAGYDNETVRYWLLEAYYYAGRYDELRKLAYKMTGPVKELSDIRPRLTKSVNFWGEDFKGVANGY